jgi:Uri superfamily endonuclease
MSSLRSLRPLKVALSRPEVDPDSGHYVLLLRLTAPARLRIGALGTFTFPAGWYVYTGSAMRNMQARLRRHFSARKKIRWHIDSLTSAPPCHAVGAVVVPSTGECALNRLVVASLGSVHPCRGFGASDCRERCCSHLSYRQEPVSLLEIAHAVRGEVVLPPGLLDAHPGESGREGQAEEDPPDDAGDA